jgi:hypothetical protein
VNGDGRGLIGVTNPDIFHEGLMKTTGRLSEDRRSPCGDLNPGRIEYGAGVPPTPP